MSFGRNPHVAKAELAEQKAADAVDDATRRRTLREAAHLWDRAAERERPGKQREQYERNAEQNRSAADGDGDSTSGEDGVTNDVSETDRVLDPKELN